MEILYRIFDLLNQLLEIGKGDYTGAILFCITLYILKRLEIFAKFILNIRENQWLLPKALKAYKNSLNEETLKLNHSWKFDGQSLKDLIIPTHVNVMQDGKTVRISLIDYIEAFTTKIHKQRQQIMLLGDAGSGKSVAMGEIARRVWVDKENNTLIPVFLKFTELKNICTENEFIIEIADNLKKNQFEGGKNTGKAGDYVRNNLYKGKLLLLLDGFDEIDKKTRVNISHFLEEFFRKYQDISFVISCRNSVWKQNNSMFSELDLTTLEVSDLTFFDIRLFISKWTFSGNKSGELLAELISEKSYLRAITSNPLMLTIITFLYSQPKRTLPDNRVKFYDECVDALLEQWDNSKTIDRTNEFETIDKKTVLYNLAYENLVGGMKGDSEILKETVLKTIGNVFRVLSRPIEKRERMLREIVENSELLIPISYEMYKFPHQTFLEYFAACYFFEENKIQELLSYYRQDPEKWEETLCLFCGLNTNLDSSSHILNTFAQDFEVNCFVANPNAIVFRLLVESARVSPETADKILDLAEMYLSVKVNVDIVKNLGFIAMNSNWSHSIKAKNILLNLLKRELSNTDFQYVLMSLSGLKEPEIQAKLIYQIDRVDLLAFFGSLGEDSEHIAQKLLDNLGLDKSRKIIAGLRDAGRLEFLGKLMLKSNNREIQQEAAYQLATTSKSSEFFNILDTLALYDDPLLANKVDEKYKSWGWPYSIPKTEEGKKKIFLIALLTSQKQDVFFNNNFNFCMKYLSIAFRIESKKISKVSDFFDAEENVLYATYKGLRKVWGETENSLKKEREASLYSYIAFFLFVSLLFNFRGPLTEIPNIFFVYGSMILLALIIIGVVEYKVNCNSTFKDYILFISITVCVISMPNVFLIFLFKFTPFKKISIILKEKYLEICNSESIWEEILQYKVLVFFVLLTPISLTCWICLVLNGDFSTGYKCNYLLIYLLGLVNAFLSPYILLFIQTISPNRFLVKSLSEKEIIPNRC